MDVLRGLAIVLMVVYHSTQVLWRYDAPYPAWALQANEALAPLRMPTLVFLSGMLLHVSLPKGARRYLDGKLRGIGYPFVVWSAIYITMTSHWGDWATLWYDTVGGGSYLWYLFVLLAYYIGALVLQRVPALLVAVASLVASGLVPHDSYMERFFFLFGFFMLGDVAARHRSVLLRLLTTPWLLGISLALTAAVGTLSVLGFSTRYQVEYLWGALAGVVALAAVARRLDRHAAGAPLALVGRYSLNFYVVHWPAMVVTTTALTGFGVTDPYVLLVTAGVAGLGSGAVMTYASIRVPALGYLFSLRKPQRSREQSAVPVTAPYPRPIRLVRPQPSRARAPRPGTPAPPRDVHQPAPSSGREQERFAPPA